MAFFRICAFAFLVCLTAAVAPLAAQDRVFVSPAAGSNLVTVLDAETLATEGSISATTTAFRVVAPATVEKLYVISRTSTDTVLVADPASLNVTKRINLGASVSAVALTPDDRYLLLGAGRLRVIRTDTDEPVGEGVAVGGGTDEIIVNNTSTRAYVLSSDGDLVQVVNLDTLSAGDTIETDNASAIALTEDNSRLLVATEDGVEVYRTSDHTLVDTIPAEFELSNAAIRSIPGGDRIFVVNRATSPAGVSQIFNIRTGEVQTVGDIGAAPFRDVVVADANRAFGILTGGSAARINLATPDPVVTELEFGTNFRRIAISPDGRALYLASVIDRSVVRVNLGTETVSASIDTSGAPASLSVIFEPSDLPPAEIQIVGGNDQFFPPGATLPSALTVRLVDRDGRPLAGLPVFFRSESPEAALIIEPEEAVTNRLGIASATVAFPADPEPPAEALEAAGETEAETQTAGEPLVRELSVPGAAQDQQEATEPVQVTASAAGVTPAVFNLSIIRATGLIAISGNFQVVSPSGAFPRPLVVLATDEEGFPLPPGTEVTFSPVFATCTNQGTALTDRNGFAEVTCQGNPLPTEVDFFRDGSVTITVIGREDLGILIYRFGLARSANQVFVEKVPGVSGDGQTADSGTEFANPLVFRVRSGFGPLGSFGVGMRVRAVSGPPVTISPRFVVGLPNEQKMVTVTAGANAGSVQIEVEASAPNLPSTTFFLEIEGGAPARLEIEGDGQTGRIGRTLPVPLRVRVVNESGDEVPFPMVTWSVVSGDAALITGSDSDGATAIVQFGDTPGDVVVRATIGSLEATFTVTSLPPEPTSITMQSGDGQTLMVGETSEPLVVRVNETPEEPASNVTVTFSGPPTVTLLPMGGGEPGNPVQEITGPDGIAGVSVRIDSLATALSAAPGPAQAAGMIPIEVDAGSGITTTFVLNVLGRTPVFEAGGVVNAASFVPGLVPGSLASIFGVGLSEGFEGTLQPGGATSFRGTTVRVAGVPAPLLSVTTGEQEQINFQVPFGISAGQTATVEVTNNGGSAVVAGVPVFSSQPGIFEIPLAGEDLSVGAVIHADGELVTPDNPAERGEALALFFTGGGALTPAVGTGVLGPIPPAVMDLPVTVTIDSRGTDVLFGGYAPGFLGLYQTNFVVPEDAECGVRSLGVRVGDSRSPNSSIAVACP